MPIAQAVDASRRNLEVSDAWVFESKLGLVQMLREHRPFEQQSLAVFSMLAANAPPLPAADEARLAQRVPDVLYETKQTAKGDQAD